MDRYLAANLILWLFTYLLISVRSLAMGTHLPRLIDMGIRRAFVCAVAFGVCILIQRVLLRTRR